jgi:hypothetical protein
MNIGTTDTRDVLVCEASPFYDSGPFGIWWGWKNRACYSVGKRAVKLQTRQGKEYLVGSDNRERLAAVIGATLETASSPAAD